MKKAWNESWIQAQEHILNFTIPRMRSGRQNNNFKNATEN